MESEKVDHVLKQPKVEIMAFNVIGVIFIVSVVNLLINGSSVG